MSQEVLRNICLGWILIALILLPFLLKITQPYGRHTKNNWGPMIKNKLGWFIMEAPALFVFLYFVLIFGKINNVLIVLATGLWCLHYFHRVVIYPFIIRTKGKKMPLIITMSGIFFNLVNGFLNGYWLAVFAPVNEAGSWFYFRLVIGSLIFLAGFGINKYYDRVLIKLRNSGRNGYKIPFGGLFKHVSCPNFLGEIITWAGFFMLTFSLPALSFFIWTIVNLVSRALDHHKWYSREFKDYPANRKAIIPRLL